MRKGIRGFVLPFLAALYLTAPLFAQVNTGNVYGNVIDEQGGTIPGGTATLNGPSAPMTTTVDANGLFRFLRVPPGKYSVTVVMPGFTTVTRENVMVSVGKNTQVDVQLKLSKVQETVTVTSATPLIDTRKVETGENFSHEELTQIPTSRDIWSLIQQVPGVQIDTVNVAGNQSGIAGGPDFITKGSGNVAYQVDGVTTTDNTYGNPFARQNGGTNTFFDFGTFQDVEVATGGSLLEQQTSGVTINVVTKRGTNEYRGAARYLYASGNWQSTNTPQEAIDEGIPTNNTRFIREYGADFGGPILKDKLWLWFAGSYQTINTNTTGFSTNFGTFAAPSSVNLEPWNAKLNWQISNSNSAQLFYQRSDRLQDNDNFGPTRTLAAATTLTIPTNFYKVEDSNVFSSDFFASLFASYQQPTYTSLANGSKGCTNVPFQIACNGDPSRDANYQNGTWYNNYPYYWAKDPQRQANLTMSKFFNTGSLNHELKFSFNYRQQIADSATGFPGSQNAGSEYTYSSSNTVLISRGVRPVYKNVFWSGTLGDTITTGNLTVQLGVRYDRQQAKNLPGVSFANTSLFPAGGCTNCGYNNAGNFPGLPQVNYHGAPGWQFDFTNWQPRISATYALGEKKTTLLRASYAQFADQLGFIGYYASGVPISNGYYYYWTDLNHDHIVQANEVRLDEGIYGFYNSIDPSTLPNVPNVIQPNLKVPKTQEITAGVDQQFGDTMAASATFTYRTTNNLIQQLPTGVTGIGDWTPAGRTECQDANGNIGPCVATAPNGFTIPIDEPFYAQNLNEIPAGVTISDRPGATQRYYGVDFSVQKRLADHWMVRANFGWNNFTQHLTAASIQNPNNLWDLGGQNCGSPPQTSCIAVGYSSKTSVFLNANWQFNINALYQGPWGLDLGANFFGREGYPNPYYVRVRGVTDSQGIDHTYFIQIGQVDRYRYDNVYELDLRLSKTFTLGGVTIVPAAELFNVANANTVLQRYQRTGDYRVSKGTFTQNPFFNQIIEVQSPRIVRLGIAVNF
ncbi:MAG TPA: TonB-dependent receptor [Thermoanaerobaculia bacterium]|nr:TonB-dependent receptor [Thermoanaerobaculia bacterium]